MNNIINQIVEVLDRYTHEDFINVDFVVFKSDFQEVATEIAALHPLTKIIEEVERLTYQEITNLKSEVKAVKEIGEQIGYGHLMSLASALWRKSLKDKGYPESGAFVATILQCVEKEMAKATEAERKMYDGFIEKWS